MRRRVLAASMGVMCFGLLAILMVARPVADQVRPRALLPQDQPPVAATPLPASAQTQSRTIRSHRSFSAEERRIIDAVAQRRNRGITASGETFAYDGPNFRATFDPEGVSFVSSTSDRARIGLDILRCGEQEIARGDRVQPTADPEGRAIVYDRGGVRERYIVRQDGIEQTFEIDSLPARRDDLVVRVNVQTAMTAPAAGSRARSLSFTAKGADALTISQAAVIDASNRRLDLDLAFDGAGYEMAIPASWLEVATLPIVVDPLLGAEILIDDDATDWNGMDIAYNPTADEWMVVWVEGATEAKYVYGQRVSSSGTLVGPKLNVDTSTDQISAYPAVAWSPTASQYLVVYRHNPDTNEGNDNTFIAGQRLDSVGSRVGARFIVLQGASWSYEPAVAWGGDSWLVVATYANNGGASLWGISVTPNAAAYALGTEFTIDDDASYDCAWPSVSYSLSNAKFLVAWQKGPSWSDPDRIVARTTTLSAASSPIVTVYSGDCEYPRVSAGGDPATEWLVCWDTATAENGPSDILAQRVSGSGALTGSQIDVEAGGERLRLRPHVAWSSANREWAVVWSAGTPYEGNFDHYANRISATGTVMAPSAYQLSFDGNNEMPAFLPDVPSAANVVLVAWPYAGSPYPVHARRFSLDYVPPDAPTGFSPSGTTGDSTPPLTWTAAADQGGSGTVGYIWQISASPRFTPVAQTGTTSSVSAVPPTALADGSYYWRVQAVDGVGNVGPFCDIQQFTVDSTQNQSPLISGANQYDMDNVTTIPLGSTTNQVEVHIQATVIDPEGDDVSLEIEVKSALIPFSTNATSQTPLMASGSILLIPLAMPEGAYHWQYRARDSFGHVTAWFPFRGNPTTAHFTVNFGGHTGSDCAFGAPASPKAGTLPWAMALTLALLGAAAVRRR